MPEARLGILLKTFTSSKNKTRPHSTFPRRSGYSRLRQQKSPRKESVWWIQELVCKWSAELEPMRTSRSPTTVMTANGEVQTREEATVYVKQLDLFVKVMLLEETLAVLSLGKLCEDYGYAYHWTTGQKPHLIRNTRELIAIYRTMHHLWFLINQRVFPQRHLHLLHHHLHHRILFLMSTDTPKIQYQ